MATRGVSPQLHKWPWLPGTNSHFQQLSRRQKCFGNSHPQNELLRLIVKPDHLANAMLFPFQVFFKLLPVIWKFSWKATVRDLQLHYLQRNGWTFLDSHLYNQIFYLHIVSSANSLLLFLKCSTVTCNIFFCSVVSCKLLIFFQENYICWPPYGNFRERN